MNTMNGRGMMKPGQQQAMGQHDGVPYEEMGYGGMPPPNRKLPPVPNQHSNYNTIDRIKNGEYFESAIICPTALGEANKNKLY